MLTAIASFNTFAHSALQPDYYVSSYCGYKAGWQRADVIGDARRHYSYAKIGNDSSTDYGYRWTQTDTVSGWSSFNHGSYWTENC